MIWKIGMKMKMNKYAPFADNEDPQLLLLLIPMRVIVQRIIELTLMGKLKWLRKANGYEAKFEKWSVHIIEKGGSETKMPDIALFVYIDEAPKPYKLYTQVNFSGVLRDLHDLIKHNEESPAWVKDFYKEIF